MPVILSHPARLPRYCVTCYLRKYVRLSSSFTIYAPEKTIRIIPARTILPASDRQARPRRDIILGEILRLDNLRFRQWLATEVTQQSEQMYLVYLALALLRGKSG